MSVYISDRRLGKGDSGISMTNVQLQLDIDTKKPKESS